MLEVLKTKWRILDEMIGEVRASRMLEDGTVIQTRTRAGTVIPVEVGTAESLEIGTAQVANSSTMHRAQLA